MKKKSRHSIKETHALLKLAKIATKKVLDEPYYNTHTGSVVGTGSGSYNLDGSQSKHHTVNLKSWQSLRDLEDGMQHTLKALEKNLNELLKKITEWQGENNV